MTFGFQGVFISPSFSPTPYPGQSESLLRMDGLDRLTDKIKQNEVSVTYKMQLIARSNELYQI